MDHKQRTLRKACIAISILGLAFLAVPLATATCVGNQPGWWPNGSCLAWREPIINEPWGVCVSDHPIPDCLP